MTRKGQSGLEKPTSAGKRNERSRGLRPRSAVRRAEKGQIDGIRDRSICMRILIAGAICRPPDPMLETGLPNRFRLGPPAGFVPIVTQLGAEPITADVLDVAFVKAAID